MGETLAPEEFFQERRFQRWADTKPLSAEKSTTRDSLSGLQAPVLSSVSRLVLWVGRFSLSIN